jgi:hypothetical protein
VKAVRCSRLTKAFLRTPTTISPHLASRFTCRVLFGKPLDLDHPRTLNEKVLWLKLNAYSDDLLVRKGSIRFGELTFTPGAGFDFEMVNRSDQRFGELLELPRMQAG